MDILSYIDDRLLKRFWSKVCIGSENECWNWQANSIGGYGAFKIGGRKGKDTLAHRIAWVIANKQNIPLGMYVLHSCDKPSCCNPKHLRVGTQADNMQDMLTKGRGNKATGDRSGSRLHPERLARGDRNGSRKYPERLRPPRGEKHGHSKLTESEVLEIKTLYATGEWTQKQLGEKFHVKRQSVGDILTGRTWKHI